MTHPTSDAGWIDLAGTELTVEQKIRGAALHEAVTVAHQLDVIDSDLAGGILAIVARFEAYIRDGAA